MKSLLFFGIVLTYLGSSRAIVDPFLKYRPIIVQDVIDNCEKVYGHLYFESSEKLVCLSSPTGEIDFSDNTEIVGTNFANRDCKIDSDDNIAEYTWNICDKNNTSYDHKACMAEAANFYHFDDIRVDASFIETLDYCGVNNDDENVRFYYSPRTDGKEGYNYACFINYPVTSFYSNNYEKFSIPARCLLHGGDVAVCDAQCSVNDVFLYQTSFNYDEENFLRVATCIEEATHMTPVPIKDRHKKINTLPTTTQPTSIDIDTTLPKVTTVSGNGFTTVMTVPGDVSKVFMTCGMLQPADSCRVFDQPNTRECLNSYTRFTMDNRNCHVLTQKYGPRTTSTRVNCISVPAYIQQPSTICETMNETETACITTTINTFTPSSACETVTYLRDSVDQNLLDILNILTIPLTSIFLPTPIPTPVPTPVPTPAPTTEIEVLSIPTTTTTATTTEVVPIINTTTTTITSPTTTITSTSTKTIPKISFKSFPNHHRRPSFNYRHH